MYTVGLTGGIASGKSVVSARFQALGAGVVDTDVGARVVVEPGQPGLDAIVAQFGERMLTPDGRLDRAALRALIFSDPEARRRLEAELHPRIRDWAKQQLAACGAAYCLLVVPLLVESGALLTLVDRVLVVDVPVSVQRQRLQHRDALSEEQVNATLAAQASREQRLAIADDVVENSGEPEALVAAVEALHQRYLALARQQAGSTDPDQEEQP